MSTEHGGSTGRAPQPWDVDWTSDRVERFWDWITANPDLEHTYFSRVLGGDVLRQASQVVPLRGVLADFGCGPGYLLERAVDRGLQAIGTDSSEQSLAAATRRLAGRPGFLGVRRSSGGRVPLDDASADVVTVIETVEHLPDPVLANMLGEAFRVTRPGGHVIVTTPCDERLGELKVMCPACACVFHQFQHVRSFTPGSLRTHMEAAGFTTIRTSPTLFSPMPVLARTLHRLAVRLVKKRLPHLLYVGRRPAP